MDMDIRRGDIYLIDFDPPKGAELKAGSEIMKRRPAVVLSRDAINKVRRTVMVVPLSTSPQPVPVFAVPVPSAGPQSVAVCDQITTINKATRVLKRIGSLSSADLSLIERSIMDALALA
jgi:mRNA interferase MazF